jgi:hypothetical protein
MKTTFALYITAFAIIVPTLYAAEQVNSTYVQGTVVRVQQHKVYSPEVMMGGSNPSDAPLASRSYAYEVSVRVDCDTYVGRYATPFNYLPSAFTADQSIQVHLTKHAMYFDLPGDLDMKMGIVRRTSECAQPH